MFPASLLVRSAEQTGVKKRQFHKEKGGPHRPYQEDADTDEDLTRPSQTCFPQGARDAGGAVGRTQSLSQLEGS